MYETPVKTEFQIIGKQFLISMSQAVLHVLGNIWDIFYTLKNLIYLKFRFNCDGCIFIC